MAGIERKRYRTTVLCVMRFISDLEAAYLVRCQCSGRPELMATCRLARLSLAPFLEPLMGAEAAQSIEPGSGSSPLRVKSQISCKSGDVS